ncbi:MAG: bifunctional phosphopantothenoylcysteine decarboxylase/phosphopantothenate--cysteine ligase CoaBC, partial [Pelagibacterales bacterium]|nr:bifunctional phosphopantothenoylcysteine decarboxylase/phosphopantothenate--cysteine ligase CoaBC [Pelagibacterales bacterium]
MNNNLKILLIISGGIAAYKSLELIRILKKDNIKVQVVLTKGGAEFVTPLSVSALSEEKVYQKL